MVSQFADAVFSAGLTTFAHISGKRLDSALFIPKHVAANQPNSLQDARAGVSSSCCSQPTAFSFYVHVT